MDKQAADQEFLKRWLVDNPEDVPGFRAFLAEACPEIGEEILIGRGLKLLMAKPTKQLIFDNKHGGLRLIKSEEEMFPNDHDDNFGPGQHMADVTEEEGLKVLIKTMLLLHGPPDAPPPLNIIGPDEDEESKTPDAYEEVGQQPNPSISVMEAYEKIGEVMPLLGSGNVADMIKEKLEGAAGFLLNAHAQLENPIGGILNPSGFPVTEEEVTAHLQEPEIPPGLTEEAVKIGFCIIKLLSMSEDEDGTSVTIEKSVWMVGKKRGKRKREIIVNAIIQANEDVAMGQHKFLLKALEDAISDGQHRVTKETKELPYWLPRPARCISVDTTQHHAPPPSRVPKVSTLIKAAEEEEWELEALELTPSDMIRIKIDSSGEKQWLPLESLVDNLVRMTKEQAVEDALDSNGNEEEEEE
jgi:hypothetical protein